MLETGLGIRLRSPAPTKVDPRVEGLWEKMERRVRIRNPSAGSFRSQGYPRTTLSQRYESKITAAWNAQIINEIAAAPGSFEFM